MNERRRRRPVLLACAVVAVVLALVATFWRSGSCTDFASAPGTCEVTSLGWSVAVAVVLSVVAVWLIVLWARGAPRR